MQILAGCVFGERDPLNAEKVLMMTAKPGEVTSLNRINSSAPIISFSPTDSSHSFMFERFVEEAKGFVERRDLTRGADLEDFMGQLEEALRNLNA